MKFNKTLTFEAAQQNLQVTNGTQLGRRRSSAAADAVNARSGESERAKSQMQPLDLRSGGEFSHSQVGLSGIFIPLQTDFTITTSSTKEEHTPIPSPEPEDDDQIDTNKPGRYRDEAHWPVTKRQKVKRFRYVICVLALLGIAFGLMSRLMLNVSIVEMVKQRPAEVEVIESIEEEVVVAHDTEDPLLSIPSEDPLLFAATYEPRRSDDKLMTVQSTTTTTTTTTTITTTSTAEESATPDGENEDDGLRFDWSKQDVNIILGAFYIGYMPGILLSGDLAQRFGAKYPLFFCLFGTSLINFLTPTIARFSLKLLIGSRILLGSIQGSLMPAMYELFSRWLTPTESSIFAPMIKVSMPLGSLIGTLMPGILAAYQIKWPNLFYIGGLMCCLWSLVWLFLATSMPQTNRFVEQPELRRIMRKKGSVVPGQERRRSSAYVNTQVKPRKPTPWLAIITNPSVLALTVVKFTYNIGLDFIFLQLAVYLRGAHGASIETISLIASCCYGMQMVLISFVGWMAKVLVLKRAFGLSVTKWRKIFQGGSNFLMASSYLILAYLNPGIELSTCLILAVAFFWMLGAGGESMVPYDLSAKFPASIVGFSHSVSIFSGIALTSLIGIVLGENTNDSSRWSVLFLLLAGFLTFGGLVFVCVLKAKPFLPGERQVINDKTNSSEMVKQSREASGAGVVVGQNGYK